MEQTTELSVKEIAKLNGCVFKDPFGFYFISCPAEKSFVWSSSLESGDDIIRQTDDSLEEYQVKFKTGAVEFLGYFNVGEFCEGRLKSPEEVLCL